MKTWINLNHDCVCISGSEASGKALNLESVCRCVCSGWAANLHMPPPRTQVSGGVLTSTGKKTKAVSESSLCALSTLTKDRRRANKQHKQVGDAQIYQENVGRVPHVFGLKDHNRNLRGERKLRGEVTSAETTINNGLSPQPNNIFRTHCLGRCNLCNSYYSILISRFVFGAEAKNIFRGNVQAMFSCEKKPNIYCWTRKFVLSTSFQIIFSSFSGIAWDLEILRETFIATRFTIIAGFI